MIQLQKILVGVDFSPHSAVAIKYAAALANSFGADVVLCHAVDAGGLISQLPPMGEGYIPPNLTQLQIEQSRAECERLLKEAGITRGSVLVVAGVPFVELVRTAREQNADLIVVGTHGRGALAHALIGSVAERVVRKAPCPVLTVRQGEHEFVTP